MVRKVLVTALLFLFFNSLYSQAIRVEKVILPVTKLERSISFFEKIFDAQVVKTFESYALQNDSLEGTFNSYFRSALVKIGEDLVELREYMSLEGRRYPVDFSSDDLRFQHLAIVVSDMDKAYARLKKMRVKQVSNQPQMIPYTNLAAGGVKAFYFKDPDHHVLELIYFPKNKRKAKWKPQKRLFLGIDHTAIAVSNSKKSRQFYGKVLGFSLKGESFNFGKEQEHLNGVEDSKVRIMGYNTKADKAIGIEFLEYVFPMTPPRKNSRKPSQTFDLWGLQTVIEVEKLDELFKLLHFHYAEIVSTGIIEVNEKRNLLVKDPDGHFLLLWEKK